ncbi:MAG: hypothetical protein COB76_02810 [Alphaproteobacteria bacterium]|nr:MAG: hypothetical protein COB76_02810 [Alphaproteobacteria bacterium]
MKDAKKAMAYKTLHHVGAPVKTAKAILDFKNQFNDVSSVPYEEMSRSLKTLHESDGVSPKNENLIIRAKAALLYDIEYPELLRKRDLRAAARIDPYKGDFIKRLSSAIKSGDQEKIQEVYTAVTREVCTIFVGQKKANNLNVSFFEMDTDEEGACAAQFLSRVFLTTRPTIQYNIHPNSIAKPPYALSGYYALGLIVHELTHFEQDVYYNKSNNPLKNICKLFHDKASKQFILFGKDHYRFTKSEDNMHLYYLNPIERQAFFRQNLVQNPFVKWGNFSERACLDQKLNKPAKIN